MFGLAAAGCALGVALPARVAAEVSDADFNALKDLVQQMNGTAMAVELDYVPLPATVIKLVEDSWKANVKDSAGKAVW